jgi:glycosyltransferase 2 family protein
VSGLAIRRLLYWVVSILVSAVLLYYALRGVEWTRVWNIITHADLRYIAAALALTTWSFFARSLRWRILLNAEGRFRVSTVFWANMAGYLGNSFLPARAGEVVRSVLISGQSKLSKTYVLTTALSERMMDVIALVLWSSIVLLGVNPKPAWMRDLSGGMAIVAMAGALFVVVVPHTGGLLETILKRIPLPTAIRTVLLKLVEQILLGVRAFHDWRRLAGFVAFTVVIWVTDATATMIGAYALGLHVSFPVAMLLLTGMGLGSALPSTPGYVGVFQYVAVTVLTPFGISRNGALAYILVAQVLSYVLVLLWGLPGLYLSRRKAPPD